MVRPWVAPLLGGLVGGLFGAALWSYSKRKVPKKLPRIILVRHGQSEANVDPAKYSEDGDPFVHLTRRGWEQASKAGLYLKDIVGSGSVYFISSPETLNSITSAGWGGLQNVEWKEDFRLREHEKGFGTKVVSNEQYDRIRREHEFPFGRFFFRWPGGESIADVYDRVESVRESLRRLIRTQDVDNVVLVAHGIFNKLFVQKVIGHSVDDYGQLRPLPNCCICVLEPVLPATSSKHTMTRYALTRLIEPDTDTIHRPEQGKAHVALQRDKDENWGKLRDIRQFPPAK